MKGVLVISQDQLAQAKENSHSKVSRKNLS